ncbi:TIGR01620 family protein [Jannaschia sp. Os4]|uniref:YcjF family protein n=1 Tax=Jannaschia sp. Os4 TaxID=2807617 RepID=UPI00193946A2|nr:TIGR01620 family protein [Jannaschia sp. Os4]MBM2576007.1 TIGR01620 family protein [Jannaschia sp. Os4]
MTEQTPRRALLIEHDDGDGTARTPADAPAVPDAAEGRAVRGALALAARPRSGLARWFWASLGALLLFAASVAAWSFVEGLMAEREWLGWVALALVGSLVLACLAVVVRELAALSRLGRIDALHREAASVADLAGARVLTDRLLRFYARRPDLRWGRDALREGAADTFDADAQIALAERTLLAPLDAAAAREVEAAVRQVAAVTAFVPLALADVAVAGAANLRMIRRVAEIYGGRSGTLGNWRLARSVAAHLVATGAVAVGDDVIHSLAGGSVLARLSRRFGEGVVNGALTARVGVAAMEVCRPLPFAAERPPRVTALLGRALTGFGPASDTPDTPDRKD